MKTIQCPGYENIGNFKTPIVDYHNPESMKTATLDVFVEKRTQEVFVGDKKPQLKLETFIKSTGKTPEVTYYDLAQRV
ncbi:MAG: hypothetical protein V1645_02730 [archaeon]